MYNIICQIRSGLVQCIVSFNNFVKLLITTKQLYKNVHTKVSIAVFTYKTFDIPLEQYCADKDQRNYCIDNGVEYTY